MYKESVKKKKTIDYLLLVTVIAITLFGAYMILSATYYNNIFDESNDPLITFVSAFEKIAIGFVVMVIAIFFDAKLIKKFAPALMLLSIVMLVLTAAVGIELNASKRWLNVGPFSFATAELAKLAAILYFPRILMHLKKSKDAYYRGGLSILIFGGVSAFFIYKQPDLSSTVVYLAVVGCMILVSGAKLKHVSFIIVIGIMFLVIAVMAEPYRMDRLKTHYKDDFSLEGKVAQANQSLMAIASGGITGVGPGEAYQTKKGHSQSETDFIFSTVAETTGFLGAVLLISAYVFMLWRLVRIAILSESMYAALVTTGIFSMFGIQAGLHFLVTTKLVPVTGVPLPLVSSGGTSTIILLGAIGIALNLSSNPEGLN